MDKQKSEVDKLFEDLPSEDKKDDSIFGMTEETKGTTEVETEVKKDESKKDDDIEVRKNRQHRRLEEQLRQEREAGIQLAERVKILSEQVNQKNVVASEPPAEWTALWGHSPEAQKAWGMQERLLQNQAERIREDLLSRQTASQQDQLKEQRTEEARVASELEALEEQFNVDLTSNTEQARSARSEFLTLVEKFSPKDENGDIIDYADFSSTFEAYQNIKAQGKSQDTSRRKEVASRSMQTSTQGGTESAQKTTPGFFGWRKDYNL